MSMERRMTQHRHCDDFIEDQTQPAALRAWLRYNREHAIGKNSAATGAYLDLLKKYGDKTRGLPQPEPKLFATLVRDIVGESWDGGRDGRTLDPITDDIPLPAGTRVRVIMRCPIGGAVAVTNKLDTNDGWVAQIPLDDLKDFTERPEMPQ